MEIKVSSHPVETAKAFALSGAVGQGQRVDGWVFLSPSSIEGFRWDEGEYPLVGEEGWKALWTKFRSEIRTDESSVHHGAPLPNEGVAVLPWGEDVVILHQNVTNSLWWDWEWIPVAIMKAV